MAQQGGKRKQAPAYSADTMALRYIAGIALAALGVMIFMAVDLNMSGYVFQGLRQVSFGLCGALALLLPALPLWAGGLVIWSTQRRAPVKPWVFALLSFTGICTFIMLISGNALEFLDKQAQGNWMGVVSRVYADSSAKGHAMGGGALGTLLAWPLWKLLGTVLGVVIIFPATVFCLLMIFNLTPLRIRDLVTGQAGARKAQQEEERRLAEQQQVAWQQQQAAMQQQQAYILEQQQQYYQQQQAQARQQQQQQQQQPARPAAQPVRPVMTPPPGGASGVEQWQEQLTTRQSAAAAAGHQSRIFTRKEPEGEAKPAGSWKSRLFGKKEVEYDGLVGEPETGTRRETENQAAEQAMRQARQQPAQPVRGREARNVRPAPAAMETAAETPEPLVSASIRPEAAETQDRRTASLRPPRPVQPRTETETEEPAAAVPQIPKTRNTENYKRPEDRKPAEPAPAPVRPVVPAVQQTIGREAFTPELKLRPSEKAPHTPGEEDWMPIPYNYPPITDLAMPQPVVGDTGAEDEMRSRKLEETLASFRVQAQVVHVTHGPAISRFEMELAPGTKVNKVSELEKDIAYGMEATSIRIEAPIPGKSLVGVEVPNRKVETVTLREVLESDRMQNAKSLLTVALGKDLTGTPIVCDLAKMPHMLIAGQTGSGKSVCINAIINSLLYRASPDEVKLILVDPKVVELQCYNGIPHLLIPVVNDPHKAAAALAWAVAEMMERYDKFAERRVRNMDGYNASLSAHEKPMARIVIIIDELADLMMVCKKDVEEYICRLTQLARAAGIHLIVATQRPSVDVITGLIKANIPSRIAFKTASYVDSRTILDRNGSEQLLGWGDMLYLPTGSFAPTRVQGCFLSDEEVNRIVKHVKDANPSTYDPDILEKLEEIAGGGGAEASGADMVGGDMGGGDGSLFEQAVEYAIQDGQISTSTLQRRLKIGYARAGRLTDEMEERGIVAAKDGSKPRKCLITREEWEEMKKSTEGMA